MDFIEFTENGVEITVLPGFYGQEGVPTSDARVFARSLIAKSGELREYAAERFHDTYNSIWRDEDEGEPEVSRADFVERLGQPSIVLYDEEGSACAYFAPDGLFDGHSIQISLHNFQIQNATLVG